jgi:uncharacterized membrane protein YfcA
MFAVTVVGLAALIAGVQNALAGGGSFLTFPALLFAGLNPVGANVTSTVALFPGQITTALAGRRDVVGLPHLSFRALLVISLFGGACGAVLLLLTPERLFSSLVPWLVLFATVVFAWGSFFRRTGESTRHVPTWISGLTQFCISTYGGYFGGGIGILMLAVLTIAGMGVRHAGATKNVLSAAMNTAAMLIFIFSQQVEWRLAAVMAVAAIAGGQLGVWLFRRVNETALRVTIVFIGALLSVGLFLRAG